MKAGVKITMRATITSANDDCLDAVAAHHRELGASASLFVPVRPVNSDEEFFPEELLPDPQKIVSAALRLRRRGGAGKPNLFPFNDFLSEIHPGERQPFACGAPNGATFVVRVNGDLYPCIYMVGQERYRRQRGRRRRRLAAARRPQRDAARRRQGRLPRLRLALRLRRRLPGVASRASERRRAPSGDRASTPDHCDLSQAILADMFWELADRCAN